MQHKQWRLFTRGDIILLNQFGSFWSHFPSNASQRLSSVDCAIIVDYSTFINCMNSGFLIGRCESHNIGLWRQPPWCCTHAGVDIDAISYATKYTTKLKTKFSVTKSSLMNHYLNQEHLSSSILLTTNCLCLPADTLAVIFRKLHLIEPTLRFFSNFANWLFTL